MKPISEKKKTSRTKAKSAETKNSKWALRLFVAGQTQKTATVIKNLKSICEEQLKDKYQIEVIDILKNPQLARDNQILAIPTLVRIAPKPVKNVIGDLSDKERVLVGLDLIEYNALLQS